MTAAMQLPITITIRRTHPLARLLCRGDVGVLVLRADGRLEIERRDGTRVEADVDPETTVFPWLVLLRYRCGGRSAALALPQVATGTEAHRRLRVWLGARAAVSAAA